MTSKYNNFASTDEAEAMQNVDPIHASKKKAKNAKGKKSPGRASPSSSKKDDQNDGAFNFSRLKA